ncbi:MAG: endonuclease NucS domain-containing protein [Methanosarcina mazei]
MDIKLGNAKHMLCRYVDLEDHLDPRFDELTYGECGHFSSMVRKYIKPGSHYFFHKTINGQRCITAHYFVTKVMEGYDARHDPEIINEYKNVHLHPPYACDNEIKGESSDIIIFGDKEKSLGELKTRLLFDRELAEKLEFATGNKIEFDTVDKRGKIRTDAECLCSATRTPRLLTDKDAITLYNSIIRGKEDNSISLSDVTQIGSYMSEKEFKKDLNEREPSSTSEFLMPLDFAENTIEQLIIENPDLLGEGMKIINRQLVVPSGRIDLLLETKNGDLMLLEIKSGLPKDDVVTQVLSYVDAVKSLHPSKNVIPAILSGGCSDRVVNAARSTGIKIYNYWSVLGTSRIL